MKSFILILALLLTSSVGFGQYSRSVTFKPTDHDDKPNSDEVPDAYTISGNFERIVVVRMKFKADLLGGLNQGVKEQGIKNGVILAAAGSVRGYHLHSVGNREFPSKNYFYKDPTRAADITSINGYVINGRVHAHASLADELGAFGGHLEPGTEVFTFAIVTIGVFGDDVDLEGIDDKTIR